MATSNEIDLSPPDDALREDAVRYLFENFSRLQDIVAALDAGQGVSGSFTTADSKTVTVVDGVITSIV